jgi:ABC-2 type transport system ATP-binding protein
MSDPLPLSVRSVSAGYKGITVFDDVNFNVQSGEIFGFIGLNGQGKTTFIKTVLGLKDPVSGQISVLGASAGASAAKKNIAYLPEKFMPAWFMSGYEFIRFSVSLYGENVSSTQIDEMANMLSLDVNALSRKVQTYSKGMAQKLGLIATVLTGAPFLILDEPMSGLDPLARSNVKEMLLACKENGQTVFLSSHILSDLDELCDRLCVLDSGSVQYLGDPISLKKQEKKKSLEAAFLSVLGDR